MKKKIFSFIGTAFCSALLVSALSSTAFAANDISVKIDDKAVQFTDVKPIIENSRTFVPFRAIFEQMDAEVSWNEKQRSITAVRDNTTVSFTIDRQEVVITENGVSQTKVIDVAPFIRDNRTYVPIRFASEALGACVDWVNDTRTVLIVDVDKLMGEYENQFNYINEYLSFVNPDKNRAIDGTFKLDMQYKTAMGNIPIISTGTLNGLKNSKSSEFSGNIKADTEAIKSAIMKNEGIKTLNSDTQAIVNSLANSTYSGIVTNNENKIYLSGAFFGMLGLDENTWAGISLNEFGKIYNISNFSDYLAKSAQTLTLNQYPDQTVNTVKAFLDNAKLFYGDSSFVKNANTLTLNQSNDLNSIKLTINYGSDGKISSADISSSTKNGDSVQTYESYNTANNYKTTITISGEKSIDISLSLDCKTSDSSKAPAYIPNGDTVDISLNY